MDDSNTFRNDGALVNVLTGLGTTKDRSVATAVNTQTFLSQAELESLYGNGIPRRYVDCIADEILRHRTTITIGGDDEPNANDVIRDFEEYLKNTQFHLSLSEVIKLQRLYGGAGLVLLVDDGLEADQPVDMKRIRAVRGYVPLSRWELIPEDFNITDWSKPSFYRLTTSQKITENQVGPYVNTRVHSTRVARFDGLYLPWRVRSRNTGWGQSVLQLVWEAYKRYESALAGLENMTTDADLFVHKIPGLFQRIASGNESDLRKRLEANNLSRSVYGGMVVDVEEQVEFLNRALTNIASATDPFVKDLQAATGWPASILMGESPGGLGKEGRFEERVWSSLVEQWQEVYCRTPITQIFDYILASREGPTRGRPPASWAVRFPTVFTQTDAEHAGLRAQMAQVDSTYISLGVLNALEVREARFGGTEYTIETTLNPAVTEQLIASTDAAFQSQMMGYEAQQAQPPEEPSQGDQPTEDQPSGEQPQRDQPQEEEPPATGRGRRGATISNTDSVDTYPAQGLRIRVVQRRNGLTMGSLLSPRGQRTDHTEDVPLVILGPNRSRTYKLYRARYAEDATPGPAPLLAGFASQRAARHAVATFFPRQTVIGLCPVPESEVARLRAD